MNLPSNNKEIHSLQGYIDGLLSNALVQTPLKKSASQKNMNESIVSLSQLSPADMKNPVDRLSPIKKRSKSQDKDFQIFSTTKNYADRLPSQSSVIFSHISQVTEPPLVSYIHREVKFKENLIMKNASNKRENSLRESRTPSILKKSQLLRNNCNQFINHNSNANQNKPPSIIVQDREERVIKTNQIVKRRFTTIAQRLESKFAIKLRRKVKLRTEQKYKDELFPPIYSSIFRGGLKNQQQRNQKIKWVRVTELFQNKELTLIDSSRNSNILITCEDNCNNFIGEAFNCIKNCKFHLDKVFQTHKISELGIYLIKIFQENVWKYVIVDDFIPVIQNNVGELKPYFLNCTQIQQSQTLQIWPFLLQKAYANYYSNYESLHFGNTLDFLQEITGSPGEMFHYNPKNRRHAQRHKRLKKLLAIENIVILGFLESQKVYVPIHKNDEGNLTTYLSKESAAFEISPDNIYEYFDRVYVFNPQGWTNSAVSPIGINIKKSQNIFRADISVRIFKLSQAGTVSISIRQKQKRFYQRSSFNYNYIWKEFDGDFRWIEAKYSNLKTINFINGLESGQYYIILLPQWKSSHCYELSCIINSNVSISLTKKQYDDGQMILEKGCCDLAQRLGRMHQINPYACSYTIIQEEVGMLIENINNERYNGDIKINRSIVGLKAAVDIIPFNKQFYIGRNTKIPFKTQISIYIPADYSYTVILMMRGGVDLPFLKKFDFGK